MSDQLNNALNGLDVALSLLGSPAGALVNPAVPIPAAALDKLLHVIQHSIAVHEAATGKPLDESQIHPRELFTSEQIAAEEAVESAGEGNGEPVPPAVGNGAGAG